MTEYEEAVSYIGKIPGFASKNDAATVSEYLKCVGEPGAMKIIHVAGTNGKGSTAAFLSSMFAEAGERTGLFTSPHLVRINERFRIGGEEADDRAFAASYRKVRRIAEEGVRRGMPHPSYFEFLFLMGMDLFRKAGVTAAVIEAGLGGRHDATNVIPDPCLTVLTQIGMDHMQYLGNTIREIAYQKAGIIRPGVPVVFDDADPEASEVIREAAEEAGAPCFPLSKAHVSVLRRTSGGIDFSTGIEYYDNITFHIPCQAAYQARNAGLALLAVSVLKETMADTVSGIRIPSPEEAYSAAARTRIPGRMTEIAPRVYVDGANNADGVRAFAEDAAYIAGDSGKTVLFAAMADKNAQEMVHFLSRILRPDRAVTTLAEEGRGEDPDRLAEYFRMEKIPSVCAIPDTEEAFAEAGRKAGGGFLFCTGSLYLAGKILAETGFSK